MNALIDGVEVFLAEAPAFSYSFYDFIDPNKIKGNTSTTISILATSEARRVLGGNTMAERTNRTHILEIGDQGNIYWRGEVRVDEWYDDVVSLFSVGGNASWMEGVKALKLSDLDLGSTEIITAEVQRASWTDESQILHYPLIDYGRLEDRANSFNVQVGDLRPALRVWPLLRAAFQSLGFSIQARGRFERLVKKLVLPSVSGEVYANANTVAFATTTVQISAGFSVAIVGTETNYIPPSWTVVSDPSGSFAGTTYTQPFAQALRPVIDIDATLTGTLGSLRIQAIGPLGTIYSSAQINPTASPPGSRVYDVQGFALPVASNPLGQQYRIELSVVAAPGQTLTVNRLTVRWEPELVYYQSGVQLDINTAAPKNMTVGQLVKSIGSLLNVKYTTEDLTGIVVAQHYDDMLKPISAGIDWRGREQLEGGPIKKSPNTPSRYLFRYDEDSKDRDLYNVNEVYPAPGWGNRDVNLNGMDKEVEIDIDFAPTNMGGILETLYGPIMRNLDAPYQTNLLEYKPRILIADGVVDGEWVHDGDTLQVYPKTFSIWPNETRYSLDFANNAWVGTTARGTVDQYYSDLLRRLQESYTMNIPIRLYDDELQSLDLTRPVLVSDGVNDGWYYVLKVDQKMFGTDGFTSCELLQA